MPQMWSRVGVKGSQASTVRRSEMQKSLLGQTEEGKEMTVIELAELLKTIDDQNQTIKVAIREDGIAPVTGDIEDIGFNPKGDAWILAVPER